MNIEEKLNHLPEIADEMLSNVQAGPALKEKIVEKAKGGQAIRFKPLRAVPALCCAALLLVAFTFGIPNLLGQKIARNVIESQPAGVSAEPSPVSTQRADIPVRSITVAGSGEIPAYKNIWARASGAVFPMISADGQIYRMLTTPSKLSNKLVGAEKGTVAAYTSDPSAISGQIASNAALEGETVYAVSGMDGALLAANVDGKLRVFQRVSYNGTAIAGGESLGDTLCASDIKELTLTGVATITDSATAQSLYNTLVADASYQNASSKETSQSLLIKTGDGLTLQLSVNGNNVMGCGTWSCSTFFDAFNAAVQP